MQGRTLRRISAILVVAQVVISRPAAAEQIIFTIDPDVSSITVTGSDNVAGPLTAQSPGSDTAAYNGHFLLDFDPFNPTTLEFVLGHGFINYHTKPSLLPGPGPGNIGIASADNSVQWKISDTVWDWHTNDPNGEPGGAIALVGNSIPATSTSWKALSGVEHLVHPSGTDQDDFAGDGSPLTGGTWTLTESSPGSGLWTLTGTALNLTIPYLLGDPDAPPVLGTLSFDGTMVATAEFGAQSIDTIPDTETSGSVLGGSTTTGGLDVEFTDVTDTGTLSAQLVDTDGLSVAAVEALELETNFSIPGDTAQIWDISFDDGAFTGPITLTFAYDESLLGGVPETSLFVMHYIESTDDWEQLYGPIDTVANTITVTTSSLSPFMVAVPEPSTLLLALAGIIAGCTVRWRRRN